MLVFFKTFAAFLTPAMVAQPRDGQRYLCIARGNGAAVSIGTEIFPRLEAEGGNIAEAADALALPFRAMRLRGVFYDTQAMTVRNILNRLHVAYVTV